MPYQAMKQEWRRPVPKLKNKFVKDRIYLPQQMPDIMAANEQANNGPIGARSLERNKGGESFMRIKDNSLASSVKDGRLALYPHSQKKSESYVMNDSLANRGSFYNNKDNLVSHYKNNRDEGNRGGRPSEFNT